MIEAAAGNPFNAFLTNFPYERRCKTDAVLYSFD